MSAVAGREGDSFLSPDVQREKIEQWAAYRGYRIVHWYVDLDVSGTGKVRRPEFERMMADARQGRFEAIAVYRLTRFARSVAAAAAAYSELEQIGVGLVSVTEDIDTTTVAGNLMRNILFALAEFESQRIGEEWRNVHASRRRRGIAHVARPMYGFKISGAEIVGVEQAEAPAVRLMFELRAKGHGLGAISRALQREGFRTKTGRTRFTSSSLNSMLHNPLYAGMVKQPDGSLIDGVHDAIITRELWEQVQKTWSRTSAMARHHSGLLSGLLICSGCGYRLQRGASKRGYDVYRCPARNRSEPCPRSVTVRADYVDEHVEQRFLHRFSPSRMPHGGKLRQTRQQKDWTRRASRLRARADELSRALDGLADQRYVKGTLAADEYDRQFQRYAEERAQVEQQADSLDELVATVQPLDRDVLSFWPTLTVEAKRRALRLLIAEIVVKPPSRTGRGQRELVPKRLEIGWLR